MAKKYYDWQILEGSYIISKRLPLNTKVTRNYLGMTKPQRFNNTSYKIRITIKYYFEFVNGFLLIESVTYTSIKTNSSTILFLGGADEKSVEALTFVLKLIERKISEYANSLPDLKNKYEEISEHETNKGARRLLLSRFESEN